MIIENAGLPAFWRARPEEIQAALDNVAESRVVLSQSFPIDHAPKGGIE